MKPIVIVPWHSDFIPALGNELLSRGAERLADTTVVFPHNRPARYLRKHLAERDDLPKPCRLPESFSFNDFTAGLRRRLDPRPVRHAKRLDLVGVLYDIVAELRGRRDGLLSQLPLDRERFFSWGLRLADLLDELLRQRSAPTNLSHLQGEVADFAAALLEELHYIFKEYRREMAAREWTTAGLDCAWLLDNQQAVREELAGRNIVIAGFYALSGAENDLFYSLWANLDAAVLWHTDPALAEGGRPHFAVREHLKWLERWQAGTRLAPGSPCLKRTPRVRFVQGFDRHSQLSALAGDLVSSQHHGSTAVVLPDTGLLMPLLHHLPEKDVNISMGYPLDRTSVFELVQTCLELQEGKLGENEYHWRVLTRLLRHPLIRMIGRELPVYRPLLASLQHQLALGERYANPQGMIPAALPDTDQEEVAKARELVAEVLRICLDGFAAARTLSDMADALGDLAELLRDKGREMWQRHLIDAECLFRLLSAVIPELRATEISLEEYPRSVLHSVIRELAATQRVSFEPEPLTGLQVLGMLETRLLRFDTVFILDADESNLPGTVPFDPLLPDPLRHQLGLPDSFERDNVAAYNFYRLHFGSHETVLCYAEGETGGLMESARVRSRFVEQLLWDKERRAGATIEPGSDDHFRLVSFPMHSLDSDPLPVGKTDAIQAKLEQRLSRGVSPTFLDTYLKCPKAFFFKEIARLQPKDEPAQDGDRLAFGILVHSVLQRFFEPWICLPLSAALVEADHLCRDFVEALRSAPFFLHMGYDLRMSLEQTGCERLRRFMANLPETTITAQEQKAEWTVSTPAGPVVVRGQFDRVDERDGMMHLLDYKTGTIIKPAAGVFEDAPLWEDMAAAEPAREPDPRLLDRIAQSVKSVQLPLYLRIYAENDPQASIREAALVELAKNGQEQNLFGPRATDELRHLVIHERAEEMVLFLIRHMTQTPEFVPRPGRLCAFCDFHRPCGM